ncbi:MAG: FG-GAP-like repeat-containing protein [bacterium]
MIRIPRAFRSVRALSLVALLPLWVATAARAGFVDVTPASMTGGLVALGSAWGDFDGDGDPDVAVSLWSGTSPSVRLYRNDGNGAFADVSASFGSPAGGVAGASFADTDEDGDLDVVASSATGSPNFLFRNDGDGTFTNAAGATFTTPGHNGRTIAWADVDGDGDLDVFLADANQQSRLLRNDGFNTFVDVTPALMNVDTQTAAWCDYDGDGDPDLYLGFSGGRLVRNDGNFSFVDVTTPSGVGSTGFMITTSWGDFDNDGNMDLYVATSGSSVHLFRNNGNGTFSDVTPASMTGSQSRASATWGDFDNDGDLDLFQGSYFDDNNHLFRNDGNASFVDIVTAPMATLSCDGAPAADYDRDGDLDLFISSEDGTASDHLLRNDLGGSNHWLEVDLRGTISNSFGIGARITAVAGPLTQTREVSNGGGWADGTVPTSHFGLGAQTTVSSLTVRWPSGITQTLNNVTADHQITVTEPGFNPESALAGGFPAGTAFDLRLDRHGVNVTSAVVGFRAAGSGASNSLATMTIDGAADRLIAAVTGAAASQNGLEYSVLYAVNGGTARVFPRRPLIAPAFVPARLDLTQPTAPASNQYVLFAVPFVPSNATLAGVLVDDLGGYDKTKWRFGRFSPSAATYLEADVAGAISPGRGFWLIQKEAKAVDAQGASQNTVGGTSIPIDPGWNQIGHPYLFDVLTSTVDFSQAPHVTHRFVGRDGDAYVDKTVLEPWKGYWVFNSGSGTESIVIPGLASGPVPLPVSDPLDWQIEARAAAGSSADRGNLAGVSSESDAVGLSKAEPPGLPGTVRAFFTRGTDAPREWTTDVRAAGRSSESFDLVVEAGEEPATLTFDRLETLPSGFGAVLLSEESLAAIDVTPSTQLALPARQSQRFRLVVGDEAALRAARSGQDRLPTTVQLAVPYPNPFSGGTTVAFALPRALDAHLAVYDVTGRLVRTLQQGVRPAGIDRAPWDGRDNAGTKVAAGIYFVKLTAGATEQTRKVTLLR